VSWALFTQTTTVEIQLMRKFLLQTKVKYFKYPELFQDTFMEFFERTHTSGSVKDTQESIKQYLSLQQHRDLSVKDLQSCDWTANENVEVMPAMKDEALDSEDFHALGPVYKELLGLNDTNSLQMPRSIAEFKSVKVGSVLYGSQQSHTIRKSFVLANWAGREGTLASNSESDDVKIAANDISWMVIYRGRVFSDKLTIWKQEPAPAGRYCQCLMQNTNNRIGKNIFTFCTFKIDQ